MRREYNTTHERLIRQCARNVGFVALVFTLTVATLLATDWYRVNSATTIRSEVLAQALAQSRQHADDQQSVVFARELDLLARRAYFNSRTFQQHGMSLLVIGLLLTTACFGVAWRFHLSIPDPRQHTDEDPARTDHRAVQVLLVISTLLLISALMFHLKYQRRKTTPVDRTLRASLKNPALQPGEVHVCPCRQGTSPAALAEQWPFLRGPTLSGRASPGAAPWRWNAETGHNILWKSKLTHAGSSSPVIWDNRLFITSGHVETRIVMAYDTLSGQPLWNTAIPDLGPTNTPLPLVDEATGYAASTPACDEKHVYAIFGTGDLVALDHNGKIVWQRFLGRPKNSYGHASSLVYCGEMLIVQWDQDEASAILAIDKNTGKTIWQTPRDLGMSWSTPLIMPLCDRYLLLVHANRETWGLTLATGEKLWQVATVNGEIAPSLTWEDDIWLTANCYSKMMAFKNSLTGAPALLWEREDGNWPDVASPVISAGLVYIATDAGEIVCHDLTTGELVWQHEFDDGYYASPLVAENKLYVVDRVQGLFRVYKADRSGQELSANPMGEPITATPAFKDGKLFIRGKSHLWCVAEKQNANVPTSN